uniref:DNA helicase/primase complex associated protein n=1 Tax=Anatid alphaherpesvirus 2 TaxID=3080522 RepID=A0AAU0K6G8_9ALPH
MPALGSEGECKKMSTAVSWLDGCVCAASIYRLWNAGRDEGLQALCALLFRSEGTVAPTGDVRYTVQYAHVRVPFEDAYASMWRGNAEPAPTAASIASAATDSSKPGHWPLVALDGASTWKAVWAAAMASLRTSLGYGSFYAPVRMYVDCASGLISSCEPLTGSAERLDPRPGILRVEGSFSVSHADVIASSMADGGDSKTTLAYHRLSALRRCGTSARGSARIEILTKGARFCREYSSDASAAPVKRSAGGTDEVFAVDERTLTLRGHVGRVRVRSLVPTSFDCLVTNSTSDYSAAALMSVYSRWYDKLYGSCYRDGVAAPFFAYLGPETTPRGEDRDYSCMMGFPGWAVVKAESATQRAVRDAVSVYAATDGLWPTLGPYAFHALAPWGPGAHPNPPDVEAAIMESACGRAAPQETSRDAFAEAREKLKELSAQWPSGRVTCIFNGPTSINGACVAKFDFSAFGPSLLAAAYPQHERLREAVAARLERQRPWIKRPLVEYMGILKRVCPAAYDAVVLLSNYVSMAVDEAASGLGFAPCTYVRDGFWGTFADTVAEGDGEAEADERRRRSVAPERVEELRLACETAANDAVARAGLSFPDGVRLALRLEGVYTDAVSWNPNCYWLWNRDDDAEDFVGFPGKPEFAALAKEALGKVLRSLATADPLGGADEATRIKNEASSACDSLVGVAFERRSDADLWSYSSDGCKDGALPVSAVCWTSADCDFRTKRRLVDVITPEGNVVSLRRALYPDPPIIPAIACLDAAEPIFAAFARLMSGALDSKFGEDEEEEDTGARGATFQYPLDKFRFLFIQNK